VGIVYVPFGCLNGACALVLCSVLSRVVLNIIFGPNSMPDSVFVFGRMIRQKEPE